MTGKPIPTPSIFDNCSVVGIEAGRKVYKDNNEENRYYTWDSLHGEVEIFNKKGLHLGVASPTGEIIKPAVKGRRITKLN